MADITPALIKELRERTQAGMSDCKAALVEAGGDIDKAVEVILKKGIVKAASRAGKVATEGEVRTWVSADKKKGVIVEVNCQTDFVARGDDFKGFVSKVIEVATTLKKGDDIGAQKFPGSSDTVDTVRQQMVAKTGENTVIRRWDTIDASSGNCIVHAYIHAGGKLAVLIAAEAPNADAARAADFTAFVENCAMQIAAMSPLVVRKEEVSQGDVAKQKEIFQAQLKEEGKPEAAWPKIIEGKVAKWFTEVTLLGQENVWAPGEGSIDKLRQELGKKLGGEVKIHKFLRFGLGEGIEKKTDDLAAEVAKMTGG
jgi:elongation factor Ts